MQLNLVLGLVIIAALAGLSYAAINFFSVKKLDEGTDRMKTIAGEIRLGANTFINYEYRVVAVVASVIVVILALLISWSSAVAFLIGAVMSASAGYIGMKIATYANVRVTNKARTTKSLSETLKVAFKGGSVMGLCVSGCALLGIFLVFLIFGLGFRQIDAACGEGEALGNSLKSIVDMAGLNLNLGNKFSMTISSYALGCSIIALFNRMGGGIYTKAADMGADLVGKTEAHLPEDDPRNPATIADNVGDNVGDVAGLGSDLLESYVGAMLSGSIMAIELFTQELIHSAPLLRALILFPLALSGVGLIGCVLGILSLFVRKKLSNNPHKELNAATWISAALTMVGGFAVAYWLFSGISFDGGVTLKSEIGFRFGWVSPMIGAAIGIVAGIVIGKLAEYYTSADYKPTQEIAAASMEGPALTVTTIFKSSSYTYTATRNVSKSFAIYFLSFISPSLNIDSPAIISSRDTVIMSARCAAIFALMCDCSASSSSNRPRVVSVMIPCSIAVIIFLMARFTSSSCVCRMPICDASSHFLLYATVLSAIHSITSLFNTLSLIALATAVSISSLRIFVLSQVCSVRFFWQE